MTSKDFTSYHFLILLLAPFSELCLLQKHVAGQNFITVKHTRSTKKAYNDLVRLLHHYGLGKEPSFSCLIHRSTLCMPGVCSYCSKRMRLEAHLRGKISPSGRGLSIQLWTFWNQMWHSLFGFAVRGNFVMSLLYSFQKRQPKVCR